MHKALQKKYQKSQTDEETKSDQNGENLNDSTIKSTFPIPKANSLSGTVITPSKKTLAENISYVETFNAYKPSCRVTSDCFPSTKKLQKSISLPLAATIVPYVSLYTPDQFPLIKRGTGNEVFRCATCRAYVNPFTTFLDNGEKFRCNFCHAISQTPKIHYATLDPITQERVDKNERADLCSGIYEIAAGSDYMNRPPMPPTFIFLVDVSKASVASGLLNNFVNIISELIHDEALPGKHRAEIAIFTYDENLHFYLIKPNRFPQLIVLDPKEFESSPFPEDAFVNACECKTSLVKLLNSFPRFYAENESNGSCLLRAISFVTKVTKSRGGRLFILQASPALTSEPGLQIKPGNMEKKYLTMLTSPEPAELTKELHLNLFSCYLFVYSSIYKNIVTLGEIVKRTGGELYYYPDDDPEKRNQKFYFEFKHCVTKDTCWEGVFRLRVSAGWKIVQCNGNYSAMSNDLLSTPTIDDARAFVYEFELDDEVARTDILYLQGALLYTNSHGQRRIRVINYAVPLSDSLSEIYERIDAQAVAVTLLRTSFRQLETGQEIAAIRSDVLTKGKSIIRELCTACRGLKAEAPAEGMVILSRILNNLMKHVIFSSNLYIPSKTIDSCNALRLKLNFLNIDDTVLHFVPYLFALHTMVEEDFGYYEEDTSFRFPPLLGLHFMNLREDGIYLMDDGEELYMRIGSKVHPQLLKSLFGDKSEEEAKWNEKDLCYDSKDLIVERILYLISELRSRKAEKYAFLNIIRQGENSRESKEFASKLTDEKSEGLG